MAENSGKREITERSAAAQYVATLSNDLASIARQHGLETLGYLLDMARLEAENVTRNNNGSKRVR